MRTWLWLSLAVLCLPMGGRASTLEPGTILVTDTSELLRIDPATGDRTVVSSASVGSGPVFSPAPFQIAVEDDGSLLVADFDLFAIVRVDPATGDRTIVASDSVGCCGAFRPSGLELEFDGDILTANSFMGSIDTILRVDPATGDRTIVSSASVGSGPAFGRIDSIFRGPGATLVAVDGDLDAMLRVDLSFRRRSSTE